MEKNLTNIVDLDKYPIHDLNSPKIKKIIEKCKTELDSDSCSVIPNFILPNSLNVMKKELEQQLDEVYMSKESINAYLYAKDDSTLVLLRSARDPGHKARAVLQLRRAQREPAR